MGLPLFALRNVERELLKVCDGRPGVAKMDPPEDMRHFPTFFLTVGMPVLAGIAGIHFVLPLCVRWCQGERHAAMVVGLFVCLGGFGGALNGPGLAVLMDEQAGLAAVR